MAEKSYEGEFGWHPVWSLAVVDVVWIKLKKRGEVAILSAQSKHFLKKE
jgi:hypothetical protein